MTQTISPNSKIAHYTIVSKIGAGGMGEVYRARDDRLAREVAIKLLPPDVSTNADRLQRFEQEARATSALNHPNILTVYDIGTHNGAPYLVAELLTGEELREELKNGPLPQRKAVDYAQQISQGLAAAHEKGITHRDLKPENIFVTSDGRLKILDFGLAKLRPQRNEPVSSEVLTEKQITDPGTVMGTVGYMSPEQVRGHVVDHRSDIFSFGSILYEMLTGQRAFQRETAAETMAAILKEEPNELIEPTTQINLPLEKILRRCLQKKPEHRFHSAHDLAFALDALSTMSGARPPLLSKPERRKPAILIAAIVTAVVAVSSAVLVNSYRNGSSGPAIQSIAVMPFVNESGNADVEYLSDGMTETLISSLSQIPNLNVKARSTVFRYKGKVTEAKTIGRELNVQAILNGRVIQRGDQLTLSLELVNADTENVIWSEQYSRKQTDLVSLQREIARDVSSKLKTKLSATDQQKVAKIYTNDPEAYRLYLQGRFYLNKRVGKLFERAEGYFKQAIGRDPNFALGYAALAEFVSQADRPKAKEYILRALALDDQLAEAHAALGFQYMLDYNWSESERELKRAMELNPNYPQVHQWNGTRLMMLGSYDESLASLDRAIELDPGLADIRNNRAACLAAAGKLDEAIAEIKKVMQIDPEFPWAHSQVSFIYRMKGDHATSVEERARAAELLEQSENAKRLRETFARDGWSAYLRELLGQNWGNIGRSETREASFLAELGEKEEAITSLTKGAEEGDWWLFSIKYDPAFDSLRSDPRFQSLLKKFNPPG